MRETGLDTYCGLSCEKCDYREANGCGGCVATDGRPFHGTCEVAECAKSKHRRFCGECEQFPCELLTRYANDPVHGDSGARIERCREAKAALVKGAREGVDALAYCGFSCNHCFLGQWCGSCRSDYNCCSYATLFEDGVCPQVACCREKGLYGCWECDELEGCKKGYYSIENEYLCKASALFIRKHGRDDALRMLEYATKGGTQNEKTFDKAGSVDNALALMEKALEESGRQGGGADS